MHYVINIISIVSCSASGIQSDSRQISLFSFLAKLYTKEMYVGSLKN
uniref:Uncharacterized protein n=1 Tax=Rhizophora mucronata TaxID=61149 RepID=A0A2P2R3H7_RHIMU